METADLSKHGTQRLEMKGGGARRCLRAASLRNPLTCTFMEAVYTSTIHTVTQPELGTGNNSLSKRKVSISISIVISCHIICRLEAEVFNITLLLIEACVTAYLFWLRDWKTAAEEVCSLMFSGPQRCLQEECLCSSPGNHSRCT